MRVSRMPSISGTPDGRLPPDGSASLRGTCIGSPLMARPRYCFALTQKSVRALVLAARGCLLLEQAADWALLRGLIGLPVRRELLG